MLKIRRLSIPALTTRLGLLSVMAQQQQQQQQQQPLKKAKREFAAGAGTSTSPMLVAEDWVGLVQSYKRSDETREMVIKKCRDLQKLSKNAIYSLHRGDVDGAAQQISSAEALARELLPTITANPTLRQGSFGNACEEYAEAVIFSTYLREARVLKWQDVEWLTCEEYLGGLMDFTGEVGRLAVAKATNRDEAALATYLQLLDDLLARFGLLELRHPGLRKKMAPLQQTCEKVQRLVYELSLSKGSALMGARMKVPDDQQPREGNGVADGEEP